MTYYNIAPAVFTVKIYSGKMFFLQLDFNKIQT